MRGTDGNMYLINIMDNYIWLYMYVGGRLYCCHCSVITCCCEPLVVSESPVPGVNALTSVVNASTLLTDFSESNSYVSKDSTRRVTRNPY